MRIGWITGWATSEGWFAALAQMAFPDCQHVVVAPSSGAVSCLRSAEPCDWIVGYSLGSHLLLADAGGSPIAPRVALLAPIWGFPREAGKGGKVARTQVRHLVRWLRRDPAAALIDFYRRAGLDVAAHELPALDLETLGWGLGQLEGDGFPVRLPDGWFAWCGADDPLLDAAVLQEMVPALRVVAGAGHAPLPLLGALAEEIR